MRRSLSGVTLRIETNVDEKHNLDNAHPAGNRIDENRDPVRRIRLERDPTIGPAEMLRPSDLLAYGPGVVDQPTLPEMEERPLRFVVKRHHATTLHTDFRLEAFGQLLSWVFWKRLSLDPRKVFAAREMPDHDPKWIESERRIPDGAYGAGPMIVWDRGLYVPLTPGVGSHAQVTVDALRAGRLDFRLFGERLQGTFRIETGFQNWRLTKLEDEYATATPVVWPDLSVITGKSLDDIEAEYQSQKAFWADLPSAGQGRRVNTKG